MHPYTYCTVQYLWVWPLLSAVYTQAPALYQLPGAVAINQIRSAQTVPCRQTTAKA